MHWYERVAASLRDRGVSNAEVGRNMTPKVTGQAITLKLQGKRPVTVEELKVFAALAGMTVAEALGDDVIVELQDEKDLIELYLLLSDEQKRAFMDMLKATAKGAPRAYSAHPASPTGGIHDRLRRLGR